MEIHKMVIHKDSRRDLYDWYNNEVGGIKSCKVVIVKKSVPIGDHYHLKKDEIFFLVMGRFLELTIGDKVLKNVQAPCKLIVPRGTYHKFICSVGSVLVGGATELFDINDEIRS